MYYELTTTGEGSKVEVELQFERGNRRFKAGLKQALVTLYLTDEYGYNWEERVMFAELTKEQATELAAKLLEPFKE